MTLDEFETWLINYIVNVYHKRTHSALGMSPVQKWRLGIFGDNNNAGSGYHQMQLMNKHYYLISYQVKNGLFSTMA